MVKVLLEVLGGSHAYGLATPDSDYDLRYVTQAPTSDLLRLTPQGGKATQSKSDLGDATSWELGHFLKLAVKSNPTVLEVFHCPNFVVRPTEDYALRFLFPHVWSSAAIRAACLGYATAQKERFAAYTDSRMHKLAYNWLRVCFQGARLLEEGVFPVNLVGTEIFEACRAYKAGHYHVAEVIETCFAMERRLQRAFDRNPDKKTNLDPVNAYLLERRKEYWA